MMLGSSDVLSASGSAPASAAFAIRLAIPSGEFSARWYTRGSSTDAFKKTSALKK